MTSTADEKTKELRDNVNKNLENMECPFTWSMEEMSSSTIYASQPRYKDDVMPLLILMETLTLVFMRTKENAVEASIFSGLDKCEEILEELRKRRTPQYSLKVVVHVVDATRCHVLYKLNKNGEAHQLMCKTKGIDSTDKIDRSTVYACRAICWTVLRGEMGREEAVVYIKKAIEEYSNCGLWHYVLGVNLCSLDNQMYFKRYEQNKVVLAFLHAYRLAGKQNYHYGYKLAKCYYYTGQKRDALCILDKLVYNQLKSSTGYLTMADLYLKWKEPSKAKHCLDLAAPLLSQDKTYLHYLGKYYILMNNKKAGFELIQQAANLHRYQAIKEYAKLRMKMDEFFNPVEYFISLLSEKDLKERKFNLYVEIAYLLLHYKKKEEAIYYFVLAMDINPSHAILYRYRPFYQYRFETAYEVIKNQLLNCKDSIGEKSLKYLEKLEIYYNEYMNKRINDS